MLISQPMPISTTEASSRRRPTRSMTTPFSKTWRNRQRCVCYGSRRDFAPHQEGPAMDDIQTIVETGIYVDDLDRAEAFYHGVLGLPVLARERGRHVFFRVGA